jgi:trehalose-6-phosphatase
VSGDVLAAALVGAGMHGRDIPVHLTEATATALNTLSMDPANTIYIVSGKEKNVMMEVRGCEAVSAAVLAVTLGWEFLRVHGQAFALKRTWVALGHQ